MSNNSFLFQSWRHLIGCTVVFECKLFLLKLRGSVSHKTLIEAKWSFNVSRWTVYLLCAVHLTFCPNAAIRTSMSKQYLLSFSGFVFKGRPCALIIQIETLQHYVCITVDCDYIHTQICHKNYFVSMTAKMLACHFLWSSVFSAKLEHNVWFKAISVIRQHPLLVEI